MKQALIKAGVGFCVAMLLSSPLAAQTPAPDLSSLKENGPVSVREGDTWSKATFVKKEGRRYLIKYEDGTEEWVTADRLKLADDAASSEAKPGEAKPTDAKPEAPKEPEKPKYDTFNIGQKAEIKDGPWWTGVKVINKRGEWYFVEHVERFGGWREWVEPWRIRKPGSTYDFEGWGNSHKSMRARNNPPTEKPGDPPGTKKPDAPGAAPGAPEPVVSKFTITEAKRDGQEILPLATGPWVVPEVAMEPKHRIPTNVQPTILPSLEGLGARWTTLRIQGGRALLIGERSGMGDKASGLVRVDIMNRTSARVEMDPESEPLALSPSGNLVAARGTKQQGRLDLFRFSPTGLQHVISFVPGTEKSPVNDAFFVDEETIVTLADNEIAGWKIKDAQNTWKMSAIGAAIARSPSNNIIGVFTKEGVAIVQLPEGKVLNMLPADRPGALSFSGDGKRLVMLGRPDLTVWDLESGKELFKLGLPDGLVGDLVAINKEFVMIGSYLFSLEKKGPVWNYASSTLKAWGGGRVFSIYNDGKRDVLTSAELPHPRALEAAKKLPEAIMVIQPGMALTLDIQPEADQAKRDQITAALTRQLTDAGIRVMPNQPLRLVARTEVGSSEQRQYEKRQFGSPFGPRGGGEIETVTITRKVTRLSMEYEGQVVWKTESWSGNDPGSFVHLREGESIQDRVNRSGGMSVDWLITTKVPTMLAAPVDLKLLPTSTWALGGVKD